mmetsp:Transcript_111694/g.315469  ORF Transcript_111694/g.315469 Transcript_111694/m.315469 type:complete len:204 (-) Transcript_111694:435-1046(-)
MSAEINHVLLREVFVNATDRPKEASTEGNPHELGRFERHRRHESGLVASEDPKVQPFAKLLGATHLADELLPAHFSLLFRIHEPHLALERIPDDVTRRQLRTVLALAFLPPLDVTLQILRNVVRLHCDVQLSNVPLELLGAEQHAEEEHGVYRWQGGVAQGLLAHLVVPLSQLRVAEHLVGLRQLLETLARLGIIWILVWMHS